MHDTQEVVGSNPTWLIMELAPTVRTVQTAIGEVRRRDKHWFCQRLVRAINGGLRSAMTFHGPIIDKTNYASASKRAAASLFEFLCHEYPEFMYEQFRRVNKSGVTKLSEQVSIDLP